MTMTMTDDQTIATLGAKQANMTPGSWAFNFSASVIEQFERNGRLSARQWEYVHKIIEESDRPERPSVIDIHGAELVAFMDRASDAGLKYPKVKLHCDQGALVIARAGERSKAPGSLTVTDGGPYGDNVFYGRIARDGTFTHNPRACTDDIVRRLRSLATSPAETAAAYGQRTGSCCFCRRALEDYRSVTVGYGPICADKYGLPWGERAEGLSKYSEATGQTEHEYTQTVEDDELDGPIHVCNDCGSFADAPERVVHHRTCQIGECRREMQRIEEAEAEESRLDLLEERAAGC